MSYVKCVKKSKGNGDFLRKIKVFGAKMLTKWVIFVQNITHCFQACLLFFVKDVK